MKFYADVHLHSHYSRATSKNLNLEHLSLWAQLKGIQVVGTGDFVHPGWLDELKEKLEPAEEGLFNDDASMHVGIRGPLYSPDDLAKDEELGFRIVHCDELESHGVEHVVKRIRKRVGDQPLYLSIDIDVLDPAHAPGTGTPEIAGITSRELVGIIRGLQGLNLVAADVVEVAPAYDHAEITSLAAATIAFEMVNLVACHK